MHKYNVLYGDHDWKALHWNPEEVYIEVHHVYIVWCEFTSISFLHYKQTAASPECQTLGHAAS